MAAQKVDLTGGALANTRAGGRQRIGSLGSDLFLELDRSVRELYGDNARVLLATLYADEALVSWSGSDYIYRSRAEIPSVRDGGGRWVTVGYIPYMRKSVARMGKAKLLFSDQRNDILLRCLAALLRRFVRASEEGIEVDVCRLGRTYLVPRIGALVLDQPAERAFYSLMGHACDMFCSQCRALRRLACSLAAASAPPRNVVETLEAQLHGAVTPVGDLRASLRAPFARAHSDLPFAPALRAVHDLTTGPMQYFKIVSLDLLRVWKLGVGRPLAQRVLAFRFSVCGEDVAVLGTVRETLDFLNLRGYDLGRLFRASPTTPGCFTTEPQATMTGRSWRQYTAEWPHMVAGVA